MFLFNHDEMQIYPLFMEFESSHFTLQKKTCFILKTIRNCSWTQLRIAIYAAIESRHRRVVTKSMSAINFVAPARQGAVVEIGVRLKKVGVTSLTLEVQVRDLTTQQIIVVIDEIVFVCVDETGKPVAHSLR
jgi:acyl-CoA thioesterase FadM